MRKLVFGLCLLALTFTVQSQDNKSLKKLPTLGASVGAYDFNTATKIRNSSLSSVFGNKEWADLNQLGIGLGINFLNGINNHFDYSVNFYSANTKYPKRGELPSAKKGFLHELDASIHMKLLPDNFFLVPYLSAGLGASLWRDNFEAFSPIGAGLQFRLMEDYFLLSNFQYRVPVTQGANYHFLYSFGFVGPIQDRKPEVKALPPAPVPVVVPPADTDGDGIIDTEDKCPTVPGVARYAGCPIPDTDGDGINDEQDKCPTVAGLARYQGCPIPDTDSDGINDEEDKCPTVKGLARYQGCPIPDTDGDGINDEEDKCPTVPGVAEFKGCPIPEYTANRVLFNSGSAVLQNVGKAELDRLVAFLNEHQSIDVVLEGHTDNTGGPEMNQKLSEKRAEAAKAYVVSKGISGDRIRTEGFGITKPVADNKTSAGRSQNRRVHVRADD